MSAYLNILARQVRLSQISSRPCARSILITIVHLDYRTTRILRSQIKLFQKLNLTPETGLGGVDQYIIIMSLTGRYVPNV